MFLKVTFSKIKLTFTRYDNYKILKTIDVSTKIVVICKLK